MQNFSIFASWIGVKMKDIQSVSDYINKVYEVGELPKGLTNNDFRTLERLSYRLDNGGAIITGNEHIKNLLEKWGNFNIIEYGVNWLIVLKEE